MDGARELHGNWECTMHDGNCNCNVGPLVVVALALAFGGVFIWARLALAAPLALGGGARLLVVFAFGRHVDLAFAFGIWHLNLN